MENIAQPLLFVSSAMLATVAMHGKNKSMNTINAIAERGVKSPDAFMSCSIPSSVLLLYNTPKVLTTSSFAGILVSIAMLERQFNPKGSIAGSIAWPIMPMNEPLFMLSVVVCAVYSALSLSTGRG